MQLSQKDENSLGILPAQSRFASIGGRQSNAMRRLPYARFLELLPYRYLAPIAGDSVLDLFGGTGFASAAMDQRFPKQLLVDLSPDFAGLRANGARALQGDATSEVMFSRLPAVDFIICHAGFHHVLGESGGRSASCNERRLEVLRLWKQKLSRGGRLVIADVPSVGTNPTTCLGRLPTNSLTNFLATPWPHGSACNRLVTSLQNPTSLGHYLTGLHERLSQLDIGDADPAAFFDNAVSKLSASGHEAHFAAPHELLALFDSAGFSNSVAFVAPTPWLFSTRREAIWFAHELLGLGAACATPDHLTESQEATLASHISRYLNLKIVSDDLCILSWHLLFVMGENP